MIPFVGPTHPLRSRTADIQRTIGMIPMPVEPGNTRSQWTFKDIPGLVQAYDLGAEIRGCMNLNGRVFAVAGNKLYELRSDGTSTVLGTLSSSSGRVGMTANTVQLVISDGARLYVLTLASSAFTSQAFEGQARIDYINQYIVFSKRASQQFGWTALGDATSIDPLSFASAEGLPDNLVSVLVDHRELILFGTDSVEVWVDSGDANVFTRNPGVAIETGAASEFCVAKLNSTVYWLASSSRGQGAVMRLAGYVPTVISTQAIEQMLAGKDLSGATAFAFEWERSQFYCLNVPGLETTLVFDALTNEWHEWAELVDGERTPHRATHHLFAFNNHYVGASNGKIYRLDATVSNNAGDPLLRERIIPTSATPTRDRIKYDVFSIDCDRGTGGSVQMRMSPDGGRKWGAWRSRSLGELGVFNRSVEWKRMNSGKDIVVHVRCTDDVPFNPVQAGAK